MRSIVDIQLSDAELFEIKFSPRTDSIIISVNVDGETLRIKFKGISYFISTSNSIQNVIEDISIISKDEIKLLDIFNYDIFKSNIDIPLDVNNNLIIYIEPIVGIEAIIICNEYVIFPKERKTFLSKKTE